MKINIKTTGITLTPSISEYLEKKLGALDKFFDQTEEILVNVEVGRTTRHHKSGDIFRAEIRLKINGKEYYTVAETPDLYASIDEVKDEIVRQLISGKKKYINLLRRGGAKIKNIIKGFTRLR